VNKIETLSLSVVTAILLLPTMLTSSGKKTQGGKEKTVQKSEDDFLDKSAARVYADKSIRSFQRRNLQRWRSRRALAWRS